MGRRRRDGGRAEAEAEEAEAEAEAEAEVNEAYQVDSFCARISAPTPRFFSFLVRPWCSATTVLKVVCSRWDSQPRAPHIARQRSLLDAWVQQLCKIARGARSAQGHQCCSGVGAPGRTGAHRGTAPLAQLRQGP